MKILFSWIIRAMIKCAGARALDKITIITGPATVYEEDGTTVHATVADGETYVLAIAYREVTKSTNGDFEFKRVRACSLPYKYISPAQ